MSQDRSYDDDEVRAIIERALQAHPERGLSHDDLLAVGAGVGLPREAIERAAEDVRQARSSAAAQAAVVARRRRGLLIHALIFLVVNAFQFVINFLTTPGEWWVLFPVFGWGLGLLFHAGFVLLSGVSPRRLEHERQRVRVASPLPAIEAHDTDTEPPVAERLESRGQAQRK